MATADVKIPGIKTEFSAHSRVNKSGDKGSDVADFSYQKSAEVRMFGTYVKDGKPGAEFDRFHDTEAKILEDIASQIKNPSIRGKIDLYTELPACQSCSNVILEFRRMFPNIELNIFTK
ncbi:hypothetical protein A3842_00665 [Paenibacillus sp. P3E]|nr:hypothetical protein A3848_27310 [Paenibacillus sp. P32E]OKP93306.1 hypothetical protein A3842_00665 [Paenibacillus sp. P3E]